MCLGISPVLQLAGNDALADYDLSDSVRGVLAEVLPIIYANINPAAYKNVTVCSSNEIQPWDYGLPPAPSGRKLLHTPV
jgi:hypothetical protein